MHRTRFILSQFFLISLLFSCQSNEIAESKTVDQNSIYQEYAVTFSERNGSATIRAAFRHGGKNGTTLLLSDDSKVTFNGHTMEADSNFISGVYYHDQFNGELTTQQPLRFEFTDLNGKKYVNEYKMSVLKWKTPPTQLLQGEELEIPVYATQLKTNERIKAWLSDAQHTASCTVNLSNGKLVISPPDLKPFKGEVTVEITREYEEEVLSVGNEGGSCSMTYEYKPFVVVIK